MFIHDNTIYDVSSPPAFDSGISMHGDFENITIQDNTITNTGEYGVESRGGALSAISIEGNSISGATNAGIRVFSAFVDTIIENTLTDSGTGILVESSSQAPSVHYNDIYDNTWGMVNDSPNISDATYNWWGHCTGPYHPTSNPGGLGNGVSDFILFNPWLHPCAQKNKVKSYYYSLRPLAESHIKDAEELRLEVENMFKLAEERGLDASQCRVFYEKGLKYIEDAKRFIMGENWAAANTFAIYAANEFEKAHDCLLTLLG